MRKIVEIPDDWLTLLQKSAAHEGVSSVGEFIRIAILRDPTVIAVYLSMGRPHLSSPHLGWGGARRQSEKILLPDQDKEVKIQTSFWGRPDE